MTRTARSCWQTSSPWFSVGLLFSWLLASTGFAATVTLVSDHSIPQVAFASKDVRQALQQRGHTVVIRPLQQWNGVSAGVHVVLCQRSDAAALDPTAGQERRGLDSLRPEGFAIRVTRSDATRTVRVVGADAAGAMYGGFELAELIRGDDLDRIRDVDRSPHMAMRGTKFNIPLDARSPSYTDACDAAQQNIAEMWSFDFWRDYIDHMARYRYNFVSLWSLHPFPSMVQVPDYPDVALRDVKRSKGPWKELYPGNGTKLDSPELLDNLETLRQMTIDEKIDFWRKVMRYGKQRNVDFYVVTWNIFTNGTYGQYGITPAVANRTTVDYFRKSVEQMFVTYPDLAGIGLTTGENMPGANTAQKEQWAFETYAQGMLDAAAREPDRSFTFIHRQHQTGAPEIARRFAPLVTHKKIEFLFSFKYAKAHVYSALVQPYHREFVDEIGDLKTIWTLRNDDVYHFRWGAPDFVRTFIKNIPQRVSRGFYLGSDQYVWGREFLSTDPATPRQIEVAKHWYHWLLWGRLGYDPNLDNQRLIAILQQRYPDIVAADLFSAWQEASMIYPVTTGFHWGALDFQWYIEACKSRPGPAQTKTGFHDVNRFITLPPHPETQTLSIPDYVRTVVAGQKTDGATPLEVAQKLDGHSERALQMIDRIDHGGDKELRLTLTDVRAVAWLGKYYAHKIRGATHLALFRANQKSDDREAAIAELTHAAKAWRQYVSIALGQYTNPLWTNRVGHCDWRALFTEVLGDIRTAGGPQQPSLTSMPPTPGGTLVEAESAAGADADVASLIPGYTGSGYLSPSGGDDPRTLSFAFDAPTEGTYLLELRYLLPQQGQYACAVTVNGTHQKDLICWTTGGTTTWAWDRLPFRLTRGTNQIRLSLPEPVAVDHVNMIFGNKVPAVTRAW